MRFSVVVFVVSEEAVDDFYFTRFGHGRQAVEEGGAVVFAGQARVGEDENAVVAPVADKATNALFEGDDGLRQGVVDEGRQAFVSEQAVAGASDGVVRRGKGQFVDDDADQAITAHVHAFPKA